jgi:two-component system sensor histidine kinase/response regulator
MNETPDLDPTALQRLQRLGGDAFVIKMIDLFVDYVGGRVAAARQAHAAGDLPAVRDAVHPIKSSAGNIGARRLHELAQQIEQLTKQGQLEVLDAPLAELAAAFDVAKTALLAARPAGAGGAAGVVVG